MTKLELIERVYRAYRAKGAPADLTKKTVQELIDTLFDELADYFLTAKPVRGTATKFTYPGFGTFAKRMRPERSGRNPRTGVAMTIPSTYTLVFALASDLKKLLNAKRSSEPR